MRKTIISRSTSLKPLFARQAPENKFSLATRIIMINGWAMVIMLGGLLYFGHYLDRLVSNEVRILEQQAEMLSVTLSSLALEEGQDGVQLNSSEAKRIIQRMLPAHETRAQVFSPHSLLIADSRKEGDTPPPAARETPVYSIGQSVFDYLVHVFDRGALLIPYDTHLPLFRDTQLPGIELLPDIQASLGGHSRATLWKTENDRLAITVAQPISVSGKILGAVLVSRGSANIAETLDSLRIDILQTFIFVLCISVLLSIYMAQTIARPLKRLAKAALQAQSIAGEAPNIPDLSKRGDEIGELSVALKAMTEALWNRLDAIEHFAADVAHELKNPLSSMRSALETLSRVQDDEQRQRLQEILSADITRMTRLITDIAHASRLEAELSRTQPELFDLTGLVTTLVSSHLQNGNRLSLHVAESGLLVRGLPGRIVQVLENLIANALSFSPAGAVVALRVQADHRRIYVAVEDSGPGIPPGKEGRIFERFYSERPQNEAFGTHSGLGLSICRKIVEGHGGQLMAENRKDSSGKVLGACFTFTLPRQTA